MHFDFPFDLRHLHLPAALMAVAVFATPVILAKLDPGPAKRGGGIAVATLAVGGWIASFRRGRAMADMPASRIATAPQGYVELRGVAAEVPGYPLFAPLSGTRCVWYRWRIEHPSEDRGDTRVAGRHEHGRSEEPFELVDDSGRCIVNVAGAEVFAETRETWYQGDARCTEWLILPGETVWGVGRFGSVMPPSPQQRLETETRVLLTEWKSDRPRLLKRFDADRDGEIDLAEWEHARAEAHRIATTRVAGEPTPETFHVLSRPADGRAYLLSTRDPSALAARFRWWGLGHLVLLAAGVLIAWFG
jgi:hypothetical protein